MQPYGFTEECQHLLKSCDSRRRDPSGTNSEDKIENGHDVEEPALTKLSINCYIHAFPVGRVSSLRLNCTRVVDCYLIGDMDPDHRVENAEGGGCLLTGRTHESSLHIFEANG